MDGRSHRSNTRPPGTWSWSPSGRLLRNLPPYYASRPKNLVSTAHLPQISHDPWHWRSYTLRESLRVSSTVVCGTGTSTICSADCT